MTTQPALASDGTGKVLPYMLLFEGKCKEDLAGKARHYFSPSNIPQQPP